MIDLAAAAAEIVAVLEAGGVSACLSVQDLNTPGVFVPLPALEYQTGRAVASWRPVAAVANTGRAQAFAELSVLLADVQAALGGLVTTTTPVDLAAVDGGGPLPAYELTFTTRIVDN